MDTWITLSSEHAEAEDQIKVATRSTSLLICMCCWGLQFINEIT